MIRIFSGLLTLLLIGGSGLGWAQSRQTSTQRLALVIGNDNYTRLTRLENARADARAMAEALKQAGFDVTLQLDVNQRGLLAAVRNFKAKLVGGGEAVFYYAGHGVQLGATNYLLPVDMNAENSEQVRDDGLPLQRVLDDMTEQKVRFSLAIVDACRDNPFPPGPTRSLGASRGLAPTTPATGQMVLYSAGSGQTALDRLGSDDRDPNGLFTRILLQEMKRPGVSVDRVLRNVRDQVVSIAKKFNHQQVPALYDQAIGDFYFSPPVAGVQTANIPAQPPIAIPSDPSANDRAFWDSVKDSRNPDEFKAYLEQYPKGLFAALAQTRLKALQSTQVASVVPNVAATQPQAVPGALASMTRGRVFRDCADCPEMVVIPAGSFTMGSSSSESGRYDDEGPQHPVRITSPFAAGKFEVTFDEWDACVRDRGCTLNPSDQGWGRGKRPVINVSWEEAKSYTQWLSRRTGKSYRLLTEAEWEYVARAGTTTAFSFGNSISSQQANYATTNSYAGSSVATTPRNTVTVGSYAPNAFGLYDVHGNVFEWTEDCFNANYNGAPSDGTAWMSGDCGRRVLRGGAWSGDPQNLRSAGRNSGNPALRGSDFGFRLARTD